MIRSPAKRPIRRRVGPARYPLFNSPDRYRLERRDGSLALSLVTSNDRSSWAASTPDGWVDGHGPHLETFALVVAGDDMLLDFRPFFAVARASGLAVNLLTHGLPPACMPRPPD